MTNVKKPGADHEGSAVDYGQWRERSAGLFMRADMPDAANGGRLVRVADVLLWMMEAQKSPRKPAAMRMADLLEQAAPPPRLWLAQEIDYAQPGDGALFGYDTPQTRPRRRMRSPGIATPEWLARDRPQQQQLRPTPATVEPGLPAFVRLLRHVWTAKRRIDATPAEIYAHPRMPGRTAAVHVADAARVWGWGRSETEVRDFEAVARDRNDKEGQGKRWTDTDWRIVCAEIKKRGGRGKGGGVASVAKDLGYVGPRALNDLIKEHGYLPGSSNVFGIGSVFEKQAGRK